MHGNINPPVYNPQWILSFALHLNGSKGSNAKMRQAYCFSLTFELLWPLLWDNILSCSLLCARNSVKICVLSATYMLVLD